MILFFSRQQLKPVKLPDTFTHMFGNLVLIETVLVEPQSESGQLSHFAITSIVSCKRKDHPSRMAPRGEKIKDGVSKQMEVWKGNCGLQIRVWHTYGFWHEWISEYIRVKQMIRTNIRIYLSKFFWHERISEYICIKILIRTNIRIKIRIGNVRIYSPHSGPN